MSPAMRQTRAAAARAAENITQPKVEDPPLNALSARTGHTEHREALADIAPNSVDLGLPEIVPTSENKQLPATKRGRKPNKPNQANQINTPARLDTVDVTLDVAQETAEMEGIPCNQCSLSPIAVQDPPQSNPITNDLEQPASPSVKTQRLEQDTMSAIVEPVSSPMSQNLRNSIRLAGLEMDGAPPPLQITTETNHSTVLTKQVDVHTVELVPTSSNVSQPTSLLTSPTIDCPLTEDPIDAIDALEDALEAVGKILPRLEPMSPEKRSRKSSDVATSKRTSLASQSRHQSPASNTSMSRAARSTPTNSLLKTTQVSALSRSNSMRTTPAARASTATTTKRQSLMSRKPEDTKAAPGKPVDYLASKRRPISMQFPPPPQPVRSSKPPTTSTFTLPGDAYTAKKKAMLAEKLKREEEELAKRRAFKARPAPTEARQRPASMIVRQTASSRARMSLAGDVNGDVENQHPASSLKRTSTVSSTNKRASMMVTGSEKRSSLFVQKRQSLLQTTQPSSTMRNTSGSRPRTSAAPSATKPPVSTQEANALRHKAKEIYNRDKVDQETRNRERREKEEATKRARAAAAERGRQLSREWAEKQKRKALEEKQRLAQEAEAVTAV